MILQGKTALVTGAGRGIGKGCALELARRGARLILNDRPGSPDLAGATEEVAAIAVEGAAPSSMEADVFTRQGCEEAVEAAIAEAGQIDILVSNPAINTRQPFLQYDPELFERVIAATLTAGFHMSQLVAREMVQRHAGGKIIFISSVHARVPQPQSAAYNAAKAGLNHMMRTIANELTEHRINVNCIEPGWIDTPNERAWVGDDEIIAMGAELPWGRLGEPVEIGYAAAFLASSEADYITGTSLRVDGNFTYRNA